MKTFEKIENFRKLKVKFSALVETFIKQRKSHKKFVEALSEVARLRKTASYYEFLPTSADVYTQLTLLPV